MPPRRSAPFRPSRSRIIVPAAAGGPTDTVARLIGEAMGRTLGQTILVENVGGAGGTIGMARVSKSAADGYTLAIWHIAHATAPALYDSLKYDVVNDFDHLGRITDVPMTLVSKPAFAGQQCDRTAGVDSQQRATRPPTATPVSVPPRICAC